MTLDPSLEVVKADFLALEKDMLKLFLDSNFSQHDIYISLLSSFINFAKSLKVIDRAIIYNTCEMLEAWNQNNDKLNTPISSVDPVASVDPTDVVVSHDSSAPNDLTNSIQQSATIDPALPVDQSQPVV